MLELEFLAILKRGTKISQPLKLEVQNCFPCFEGGAQTVSDP